MTGGGGAPVRIVQISDTHLSHRRGYAVANVSAALDWIEADRPDLVVHTGDITADDPDDEEEADYARRLLLARDLPLVVLPGNHDVGGFSGDLVEPGRLAAFRRRWGADSWALDVGAWRLVGANVYRLDEPDHRRWLRDSLATDAPIALFLHQPICLVQPDQADAGDWSLSMPLRSALLDAMRDRPIRLVASGHLHRYRAGSLPGGTATVWAPAASFTVAERADGAAYRIGVIEHLLASDGTTTHRLVEPPGVVPLNLSELVPAGSHGLRDALLLPVGSSLADRGRAPLGHRPAGA